jgi:hypothetical protein
MDATSETKPADQADDQPFPRPLPVAATGGARSTAFKEWQKLPAVWIPPPAAPLQSEDFREFGVNR